MFLEGKTGDHLPGLLRRAHQDVPQKALTGILVVRCDAEGFHQFADGADDLVRLFVFDEAVLHGHYIMRACAVHAGDDVAPPVACQHSVRFVAVMEGIFHADDGLYPAEGA